MNRDQALAALQNGYEELMHALGRYADEEWLARPITGEWTGKDLLAHVTRWQDTCSAYLGEVAAGRPISRLPGTSSEMNGRYYAADRFLPLDQVRRDAAASYARVRDAVALLSDEQLDRVMRGPWPEIGDELPLWRIIAIDTWDHYPMHLQDFQGG